MIKMTPDEHAASARRYSDLAARVSADGDRLARMKNVVEVLWDALSSLDVSWLGFYIHEGGDELVLGPMRNKPACSPIELHGVCGQAFKQKKPIVVHDVKDMGANYVACDPRDKSELVIPLLSPDGACWGVLDLDSHSVGAFSDADVQGLLTIVRAAGLTP